MTEESKTVLRGDKCAGIILCISEMFALTLEEATELFYNSETGALIEDGIADLHCRSNKYLATLIWEEHSDAQNRSL